MSEVPEFEDTQSYGDVALRLTHAPLSDGGGRHFLVGGGEMGALMRSIDWSQTPLGPVETWSPSLRMMLRILLANRFPILLWWGPQYIQLYNDAYRPILGAKHPRAMGQRGSECFPEIWHIIGPLVDTPFGGGPATWMEDISLEINRYGFMEETHFTIAYSPVPDDTAPRGIGGVLATVHEISEKVVGERRIRALRDLGAHSVVEAKTAEEACHAAAAIISRYDKDVPFAVVYLNDADGKHTRLAGAAGLAPGEPMSPLVVELTEPASNGCFLTEAMVRNRAVLVDQLQSKFNGVPPGPWSDPPHRAVVLPIPSSQPHRPAGAMVVGVSSRLELGEQYRVFLELLTKQVATAVANARAYEEEQRRAQALAELDRAKTTFFSNVSHEFRTPLTLMLGPLRDVLGRGDSVSTEVRGELDLAHRNALRLLKLVNTLLDFSRIEAGRVTAVYEPIDLAAFTAELASSFRSALERAGLRLVVATEATDDPVYVDRDMWEKIVLNLLSNAFKHTFEGEVTVSVRRDGEHALLELRDTGVGIPDDQLPHVFERFHRVANARSRTHEGTGIGLALVQELVKLHGGVVDVSSEEGVGTTFTVRIPVGTAHLPPDRISAVGDRASTGLGAAPFVEEALRWLPNDEESSTPGPTSLDITADALSATTGHRSARILVADDNADMRSYLARLLGAFWSVEAVSDGAAALEAIRESKPDLLLADVMMPRLDGFGLLHELRADPQTREIPAILLSARAGEESRVEGLNAGADDYLVKPFAARELIARVSATLDLARVRSAAAEQRLKNERLLLEQRQVLELIAAGHPIDECLAAICAGVPRLIPGSRAAIVVSDDGGYAQTRAVSSGVPFAFRHTLQSVPTGGWTSPITCENVAFDERWTETQRELYLASGIKALHATPVLDASGATRASFVVCFDEPHAPDAWELRVAEFGAHVASVAFEHDLARAAVESARDTAERARERLRLATEAAGAGTWDFSLSTGDLVLDARAKAMFGLAPDAPLTSALLLARVYPDDVERIRDVGRCALDPSGTGDLDVEFRVINALGAFTWVHAVGRAFFGEVNGERASIRFIGTMFDITERRRSEDAMRTRTAQFETLLNEAPIGVYLVDADFRIVAANPTAITWMSDGRTAIGRSFDELIHILWPARHADDVMALFRHTLDTGEPFMVPECTEKRLDTGATEYYEWQINRIPQPDGRFGVVCYFRDISAVVQAREGLASANRAKSEFLATMSHELRTPLNAIAGYVELVLMGIHGPITDAQRDVLGRVVASEQHLLSLINDVLNFAKLEAGRIEYRLERAVLAEVVVSVMAMIEPQLAAKKLSRTVQVSDQVVVRADREKLRQILLNLFSNAIKFTDDGGQIVVRGHHSGGTPDVVVLSVADTGVGIPLDKQNVIFDPFVQVHRDRTRTREGTGLGLAISRDLARGMGGELTVASQPGAGSTFTLTLPSAGAGDPARAEKVALHD